MARTGRDPAELYGDLTGELGAPVYERSMRRRQRNRRRSCSLSADAIAASELAGDPIQAIAHHRPGNGAAIGG